MLASVDEVRPPTAIQVQRQRSAVSRETERESGVTQEICYFPANLLSGRLPPVCGQRRGQDCGWCPELRVRGSPFHRLLEDWHTQGLLNLPLFY